MNIRKNIIAVMAAFGCLASQAIIASPLAGLATGIIKNPTLRTRFVAEVKKTAAELIKPLENDVLLVKAYFRSAKLGQQSEEIFNACIPNKTMRKLVILKICEWGLTMPGFILASQGDTQAIAYAIAMFNQYGIRGIAANAALLSGAASYYGFEHARKLYQTTTETINRSNRTDLMTWSA